MFSVDSESARGLLEGAIAAFSILGGCMAYLSGYYASQALAQPWLSIGSPLSIIALWGIHLTGAMARDGEGIRTRPCPLRSSNSLARQGRPRLPKPCSARAGTSAYIARGVLLRLSGYPTSLLCSCCGVDESPCQNPARCIRRRCRHCRDSGVGGLRHRGAWLGAPADHVRCRDRVRRVGILGRPPSRPATLIRASRSTSWRSGRSFPWF